jgi:hypothetical protein
MDLLKKLDGHKHGIYCRLSGQDGVEKLLAVASAGMHGKRKKIASPYWAAAESSRLAVASNDTSPRHSAVDYVPLMGINQWTV